MNIFDLPGPLFLLLYLVGLALAWGLSVWLARQDGTPPGASMAAAMRENWTADELAYLGGGNERLLATVLTRLARSRVLLRSTSGDLIVDQAGARLLAGLDKLVADQIAAGADGATLVKNDYSHWVEERLVRHGLVRSVEQQAAYRTRVKLPFRVLLGVGAVKLVVGFVRGRPIGFLLLLLGATWLVQRWRGSGPASGATPLGRELFERKSKDRAVLRTVAKRRVDNLSEADIALAVALFGVSGVALAEQAWLSKAFQPKPSSSSGDGGGSSCGGSSCGGGCGGGCGGCGG